MKKSLILRISIFAFLALFSGSIYSMQSAFRGVGSLVAQFKAKVSTSKQAWTNHTDETLNELRQQLKRQKNFNRICVATGVYFLTEEALNMLASLDDNNLFLPGVKYSLTRLLSSAAQDAMKKHQEYKIKQQQKEVDAKRNPVVRFVISRFR